MEFLLNVRVSNKSQPLTIFNKEEFFCTILEKNPMELKILRCTIYIYIAV